MLGRGHLSVDLAIDLYQALLDARRLYLQPALGIAVANIGVVRIDAELQLLVPEPALNHLARLGLRGERVFPVPSIITHTPSLLGYYRMLLGFSKKEFQKRGFRMWVAVEEKNMLSDKFKGDLEQFCTTLIEPLTDLVYAMNRFEDRDLSDLALLTLGPTLQGGRNNVIGSKAEKQVFQLLRQLVQPWIVFEKGPLIRFTLPEGKTFELINRSDPDICLHAGTGITNSPLLAIEIKGGGDASNAHNRAGEAEKSHLKAAAIGYSHLWTIIRMPQGQRERFHKETLSSTAVFEFDVVVGQSGEDWLSFQQKFLAILDL